MLEVKWSRVLAVLGVVLVSLGALLLLFTAYQLWGTGIAESHSQSRLRSELQHTLGTTTVPSPTVGRSSGAPTLPTGPPTPAPVTTDPVVGQPVATIDIPSIGLDQVVVEGVGTEQLRLGPGHYPGTALPGQPGNAAIAGHRTTYGHPFSALNELVPGAPVILTTTQGVFVYTVEATSVVQPTDVSVLEATQGPTLTLTTCTPRYSAAQRLVVRAVLAHTRLSHPTPATPATTTPPPTSSPSPSTAALGLAGDASNGSWLAPVLWGAALLVALAAALLVARRTGRRLLVTVIGVPVGAVILFFFFASLSPLLPASY